MQADIYLASRFSFGLDEGWWGDGKNLSVNSVPDIANQKPGFSCKRSTKHEATKPGFSVRVG